jgi:SAM-dependent methyltransferase
VTRHENALGKPLADVTWLEAHHRAKLPERTAFARRLAALRPRRIVDLGCAGGHWLGLLNEVLPPECEFVGVDGDEAALGLASQRAQHWQRPVSFVNLELETDVPDIPAADLTLAFNVFSYIQDLGSFLSSLAGRQPAGVLAVRQYDGASIRFGPMPTIDRQQLESTLRASTSRSARFNHYDLDRAFDLLHRSPYKQGTYEFELFVRVSPFPDEFLDYYRQTLEWTRDLLSAVSTEKLDAWIRRGDEVPYRYFLEVDLVAMLS